jgi:MFS transporter, DHA1 family, tetracycline resistance protein
VSEGRPESVVEASPVRSAAVAFIFITILLDTLAPGLVIPVLPKLVESFVDNDTARAARIFGLFGTAWAAMQFFFSPVLGGLSDRFGRRPVVLLSNFGLALDYVLMALAPSLTWLFSGITSASISTSFATSPISRLRNGAPRCSARSARRSGPDLSSAPPSADCWAAWIRGCRSGSRRV